MQFIVRITNYVQRWVEMASCEFEWKAIQDLLGKEQFLNSCPNNLAVYLKEQAPKILDDLLVVVNQFLQAHNFQLWSKSPSPKPQTPKRCEWLQRWNLLQCHQTGHRACACPKLKTGGALDRSRKRFIYDKSGHLAQD